MPTAPFTVKVVFRCFTEAETQSRNPQVAKKNCLLTGREGDRKNKRETCRKIQSEKKGGGAQNSKADWIH